MKIFIISFSILMQFFTFFTYYNSPPSELQLWCKNVLQQKKKLKEEPLGKTLIEVCSSNEHLNILQSIIAK